MVHNAKKLKENRRTTEASRTAIFCAQMQRCKLGLVISKHWLPEHTMDGSLRATALQINLETRLVQS